MNARRANAAPAWQQRDLQWCRTANRWAERRLILSVFGIASRLGDGIIWYALVALLAITAGERGRLASLHMAIVGVVACLLYRYLKRWTRRPRPFRHDSGIIARVAPLDEYSFPSGHTLHAVHFSLIAIAYFPLLAIVLIPLATLIAASRVVLGLHYPSDVLAAIVIGCLLAGGSFWIARVGSLSTSL